MKRARWWIVPLVVLVVLALLEIVLRLTGTGVPPPSFCPDGSPRGKFRYGIRNRYLDARPNDVARYVVCLGDSWVFGLGLKTEDTWPARLEALLKKHQPDTRVVNASLPDATSADVRQLLRPMINRYHAKAVVIMVGAQDAAPVELLKQHPLGQPFRDGNCPRPWFRLGHLLARRWQGFQLRLHPPDPEDNKSRLERRLTVTESQMNLLDLGQFTADAGVRAVFVTYPKLPPGKHGAPFLPLESRYNFLIHAAALSFGHGEVDLEKRWGGQTERFLLPWLDWPHPNANGHADIAQAVAAAL